MPTEAKARIRINDLLDRSGWRFFDDEKGHVNITLETHVKLTKKVLDALGNDFEKTAHGFVDYLLLDDRSFPICVLEAKSEKFDPLVGKEQARKYARSQNVRFIILSNGNLQYFWDLEQGNPGLASILKIDAHIHDGFVGFRNLSKELLPEFLYSVLTYFKEHNDSQSIGAVFKNLTTDQIKELDIPVPAADIQRHIVAELEAERALVESNRKLIEIFEAKINAKLDEIWGEEGTREEAPDGGKKLADSGPSR